MNETTDDIVLQLLEWLGSSGLRISLVILAFWLAKRFGSMATRKIIQKSVRSDVHASSHEEEQRENTLIGMVNNILRLLLWFVAILVIIGELGIELGPFIAGASIFSVAIGFGAQSLIKDFTSGMFIILENQYRVGDIVTIAGQTGRVVAINIRDTVLRDLDGHVHYVPNGSIDVATNMTMEYSAVNLKIGVGYETDINKAQKVINDIGEKMATEEEWQEHIISPPKFVRVHEFGDSAVELRILGKVHPGKQWKVAGEFRQRLKKAFDKHQIDIPYPQVVMHNPPRATKKK